MSLFIAVLFYVLTPGILLTLPKGGSKMMVAATHAVVFALVFHFTHKMAWKAFEGFKISCTPGKVPSADGKACVLPSASSASTSYTAVNNQSCPSGKTRTPDGKGCVNN